MIIFFCQTYLNNNNCSIYETLKNKFKPNISCHYSSLHILQGVPHITQFGKILPIFVKLAKTWLSEKILVIFGFWEKINLWKYVYYAEASRLHMNSHALFIRNK